jgi:histone H3|tara:strand:- start:533 stop:907 length:375 start_codon:yes stop_codon:yes gene_type:complete
MARTKALPIKHESDGDKGPTEVVVAKRTHRWKSGTVALREIKKYQRTVDHVIPRTKMVRLIREIAGANGRSVRFKGSALDALHTAAEKEMVDMFERAMLVTINGKGTTLKLSDLSTANAIMRKR